MILKFSSPALLSVLNEQDLVHLSRIRMLRISICRSQLCTIKHSAHLKLLRFPMVLFQHLGMSLSISSQGYMVHCNSP